jgi:hypothetical protein
MAAATAAHRSFGGESGRDQAGKENMSGARSGEGAEPEEDQ